MGGPIDIFVAKTQLLPFELPTDAIALLGRSHSPYHVQADTWDRAMLAMDRRQLEHLSHHPLRLLHEIWQWEWHALIIWGVVAAIAMPLLAVYLRRALVVPLWRHKTLLRSRAAVH
jgi:hypothetical protein